MPRNIVLCSDGTGNKGGHGAATNVYKIYQAVDNDSQVVFYDIGVGTSTNKIWKAITGAFGIGLKRNVRDLYDFLGRHYDPGDQVYLFGFSRGAATVRAFAGLIETCGLLRLDAYPSEDDYQDAIDRAMRVYTRCSLGLFRGRENSPAATKAGEEAQHFRLKNAFVDEHYAPDGRLKLKMLGIWDTVSALGLPQDWPWFVNGLFEGIDWLADKISPHHFYDYGPANCVENVHHALALDDQRRTFWPRVWDEKATPGTNVEQVWFSGAHSNVGGGYPRAGLSDVTLNWMMIRAEHHGLVFEETARQAVRDNAFVHDKLYDSRDGFAIFYRFAPRPLEDLCARTPREAGNKFKRWVRQLAGREIGHQAWSGNSRLNGKICIHQSVFSRMKYQTEGYAPTNLPYEFAVTTDQYPMPPDLRVIQATETPAEWGGYRSKIGEWINRRRGLHRFFVEGTLALVLCMIWFWMNPPMEPAIPFDRNVYLDGFMQHVADVAGYILPQTFEGIIQVAIIDKPGWFGLFVLVAVAFFLMRRFFLRGTWRACLSARRIVCDKVFGDEANARRQVKQVRAGDPLGVFRTASALGSVAFVCLIFIGVLAAGSKMLSGETANGRAAMNLQHLCGAVDPGRLRSVEKDGEVAIFPVSAADRWNASGVRLEMGKTYRISVVGAKNPTGSKERSPIWHDASAAADLDGWIDAEPFYMRAFDLLHWKRMPDEPLFKLIGVVANADGRLHEFAIGGAAVEGHAFDAPLTGEFCAYANDLYWMYGNNSGGMEMAIERVR